MQRRLGALLRRWPLCTRRLKGGRGLLLRRGSPLHLEDGLFGKLKSRDVRNRWVASMAGIFVIKGMTLGVSNFSLHIDDEGNVTAEGPDLTIAYDACIAWAKIALEHRDTANAKMENRRIAWRSEEIDEAQRAQSLEAEFYASIQAVTASVTCIDALYDHLLPYSPITSVIKKSWSCNRTARYIQITETIRATFAIKPKGAKAIRESFRAMFTLRNAAIHPSNALCEPYPHPELGISTDWRLTAFRGDVADTFVCHAVGLLWDITRGTKFRTLELTKFMGRFRERVDRLLPDGKPIPSSPSVTYTIPKRSGRNPGDQEAQAN